MWQISVPFFNFLQLLALIFSHNNRVSRDLCFATINFKSSILQIMDSSTSADPFMYHSQANTDPSLNNLFDDLSDFTHTTRDAQNPFDLIDDGSGLATFTQQAQPVQHAQSQYNQAQHQTQSQSPALPQFRPSQNSFPHQYGQNAYNQQSMQNYDPALAARPTPSPGPYDQFAYHPQHMNYSRNPFDYTFNSFDQQRQSTPSQAFHPQVTGQPQAYMNMSRSPSQPQSHISQVQVGAIKQSVTAHADQFQNLNGLAPYSFQPNRSVQQGFVDPSMLGAQAQQSKSRCSTCYLPTNRTDRQSSSAASKSKCPVTLFHQGWRCSNLGSEPIEHATICTTPTNAGHEYEHSAATTATTTTTATTSLATTAKYADCIPISSAKRGCRAKRNSAREGQEGRQVHGECVRLGLRRGSGRR